MEKGYAHSMNGCLPIYGHETPALDVDNKPSFDSRATSITQGPVVSYDLFAKHVYTKISDIMEIQCNGQSKYWITTVSSWKKWPLLQLRTGSENGPVLAACKTSGFRSKCRIHLGPDCSNPDADDWLIVENDKFWSSAYRFSADGRELVWKTTNNNELGASKWSSKDFKLVDTTNGDRVVAAMVWNMSWKMRKWNELARIDLFETLDERTEHLVLAVLLGIVDYKRRMERAAILSGGGGGGGGGG